MPGLGKKTFTAGDVLIAGDVNNYLMDQTVMNFATTAARSSAIPVPSIGMVTYVGTTGTALIPQIETYTGAGWQTPYGLTQVANVSFTSGTTVQIRNVFTSAFDNYLVQFTNVKCSAPSNTFLRLSVGGTDATGTNYQNAQIFWSSGTLNPSFATDNFFPVGGAGNTDNTNLSSIITLTNPAKTLPTGFHIQSHGNNTSNLLGGMHQVSTAYDGFTYAGGTFTSGSIRIFGYRNL